MLSKFFAGRMVVQLAVLLVLFSAAGVAEEERMDASGQWKYVLEDMLTIAGREPGAVTGAVQTADGTLLTGTPPSYFDEGWIVFLDRNGNECWSYAKENVLEYSVTALRGGGFAAIRRHMWEKGLIIFDKDGNVLEDLSISSVTRDIHADGDIFLMGNETVRHERATRSYSEEGLPYLTRMDPSANIRWSRVYEHGYEHQGFQNAVLAEDSLIISAWARKFEESQQFSLLHRMDLDGEVLWTKELIPENGDSCEIYNFCVGEDGTIAVLACEYQTTDDDGGEYGDYYQRLVLFGISMDGDLLWRSDLKEEEQADCILPLTDGFLCVMLGTYTEEHHYPSDSRAFLLDRKGNVQDGKRIPNIGGGQITLSGVTFGENGKILVFGTVLKEPGIPGMPFCATLDFTEAY